MTHGIVSGFSAADGFGMIHPDDERGDLRFSAESVAGNRTITVGDHVEFDVVHGPKGPEAVDVRQR